MEKQQILSRWNKIGQINYLVISLVKPLLSQDFSEKSETEFLQFPHCTVSQCGKMKNLVSPKNISSNQLFSIFYSKNITFTKFLPKMREREITVTLFWQKIRENNVFSKKILKSWFDEIFMGDNKFFIFPHCAIAFFAKISW